MLENLWSKVSQGSRERVTFLENVAQVKWSCELDSQPWRPAGGRAAGRWRRRRRNAGTGWMLRQKRIGEEETSREPRELDGSNIDWEMILRGLGRGLIGMNGEEGEERGADGREVEEKRG